MYVKNGVIFMAWKLYDEMSERNVVTWNAMICGLASMQILKMLLVFF